MRSRLVLGNLRRLSSSRLSSYRFFSSSIITSSDYDSTEVSLSNQEGKATGLRARFPVERIVWLGRLPSDASRESIISALSSAGGIADIDIMSDRFTGQPRGYGFAAFESADQASAAIQKGSIDVNGTIVEVKTPRQKEDRSMGGRKIFIGNVGFQTTKEQLEQELQKFGEIDNIHIPVNVDGRPRGYAFIVFKSKEDTQKALEQKEIEVNTRILRLEPFANLRRPQRSDDSTGAGGRREGGGGYGGSREGGYGGRREGGGGYGGSREGGYGGRREGGGGYGGSREGGSGYSGSREGGSGYGGSREGRYGGRREGGGGYGGSREGGYGGRRNDRSSDTVESKEGTF